MTLEDLQEVFSFTLYSWLVMWLANSSMAINIGHVLHLTAPQRQFPGALCTSDLSSALTKRSLKIFGQRKAINGDKREAFCSRSKVWRTFRCYPNGMWTDFPWSLWGCRFISLVMSNARWLYESSFCSLQPLLLRWCFNSWHRFWRFSCLEQILQRLSVCL